MLKTGLVGDPAVREHDTGRGHPEQPARYSAVMDRLHFTGLFDCLPHIDPKSATVEQLTLVHSPAYIALAEREVKQNHEQLSTGDTSISLQSFDAALRT